MINGGSSHMNQQEKAKKIYKIITAIIVGITFLYALVLAGIFFYKKYTINNSSTLSTDITSIQYDELHKDEYYLIDSLLVIDECANYTKDNKITKEYITVCFYTQDDVLSFAVLEVENTSPIYSYIIDYLSDDDKYIGDCYLSGYFYFDQLTNIELKGYYEKSIEYFKSLGEVDFEKTEFEITYISENNSLSFQQTLKIKTLPL